MISVRHGSCMNSSTGGNGMCRKKPMVRSGRSVAQHFWHQLQLVILHPYGPAAGGRARRSLGEPAVDLDVALPPFAVEDRLDDDVVVQRPQRGVGETLVVLGDVLGGQRHLMKCQVILDDRLIVHVDVVVAVRRQARPADPGAAPTAQQRLQGRDQPPGLRFHAVVPSGSRSKSTGSRLATTTKSESP